MRAFEGNIYNFCDINSLNDTNYIHDDKANNIFELILLHDILNPSKCTKDINRHDFHIIHRCMNTRRGKTKILDFIG